MNENSSVSDKLEINVDIPERLISVAAGAVLASSAIRGKNFSLPKLASGLYMLYRGFTGHCSIYKALDKAKLPDPVKNINVRLSVLVGRPRAEVYNFWRNVENLPLFMKHLESVKAIDSRKSHWRAIIPTGGTLEWYAEIVKDIPNELIGWNSLAGSSVANAGKVEFSDVTGGATKVDITITYRAPLGFLGQSVSRLLTPVFEKIVQNDVRSFKEYLEKISVAEHNLDTNITPLRSNI